MSDIAAKATASYDGGPIKPHKAAAMEGAGEGSPTMASTQGMKYNSPNNTAAMPDSSRAHPGRGGKKQPSHPGDVDHGHTWGKK
jgi:hypothetical protein